MRSQLAGMCAVSTICCRCAVPSFSGVCCTHRFRELGCSSAAVRIQAPSEDGAAAAGSKAETTSSYNITLLASGDKNLAQSFPRPKVMKKQGAR